MKTTAKEKAMAVLQKDFSEKVASEILNKIDRLADKNMDVETIEKEVSQDLLRRLEKDVDKAIIALNGGVPKIGRFVQARTPSKRK